MRRIFQFVTVFFIGISVVAQEHKFMHVEYYVWYRHEAKGIDKDAFKNLDILYYFKAEPDKNGRLLPTQKYFSHLEKVKAVKNEKMEIWIGVGSLKNVGKDEKLLDVFIKDLKALCQKCGFSGVDIDWEGPDIDNNDYKRVVSRISEELRTKDKKKLAVSVGPGGHYTQKIALVKDLVDFVNVQCYYSTMNAWTTAKLLHELEVFSKESGLPKSKMFIGLPLYGAYDAGKHGSEGGTPYRTMIEKGADPNKNVWLEPETKKEVFYSGIPLIKEKVRVLKKDGYAGVFSWEFSLDLPYKSEYSILKAIDEEISVNQ